MTYSIIQPPFTLKFRDMSKKDLVAYAAWFHDAMPGRIAELANAVRASPGHEDWQASASPESLDELGRWFEGQVETRRRSAEELAEIRSKLAFPIDIPEEELTDRTFSLAFDLGMYFAQVVLSHLPGTRWDQPFGSKKLADYGQPVILGFGPVALNPVHVMVTTAYGIASKKPAGLRELYDTWAGMKR
ncbi:MAG TPA: hypothetical protein VFK02_31845 [Kofleriaceae bacterium]|nr:hypothetical protein [Kofleriaceae bacterium]